MNMSLTRAFVRAPRNSNRLCVTAGGRLYSSRLYSSSATAKTGGIASSSDAKGNIEIKITPIPRDGEDIDKKRARLLYQSRKRGILETDLLLSNFANKYLKTMTLEEMEEYDKLLDEQDWDIYYWATYNNDMKPCPEKWEKSEVMAKLRILAENRDRNLFRMPDL